MSRPNRPRQYCGAKNPFSSRSGAACVFSEGHTGQHQDLDRMRWDPADGGLYPKFSVQKTNDPDNKHLECSYFVLDLTHDPAARRAAIYYADLIRRHNPELADDLTKMVEEIQSNTVGGEG